MKRIIGFVLAGWFLLVPGYWVPSAWADDLVVEPAVESAEPAVINHPGTAWDLFKASVSYVDPQPESLYRFNKQEWDAGVAGSLYNVVSKDYHLGRAKLGYAMSNYGYGGVDVDLGGLYGRFAGGKLPVVDKVISVWSKYATTGVHYGWDFEDREQDYGFTIGASIPWPTGP